MKHTNLRLAALLLGLAVSIFAPGATLALGQAGAPASNGPLVAHHRAAQLPEAVLSGSAVTEPVATYGMISMSHFEVVAVRRPLDWKTIRFLEANFFGWTPEFAYVAAPLA